MPDEFKTRDVCSACNNNLGLFVDASFEKDFLVYNHLREIAYDFFNPDKPSSLPLQCMGTSDLTPPGMSSNEVCELWLGPLGEQVYWIRPKDIRLYWYSGGNPRTVKKANTTAYFMASERTSKNPLLTLLTFRDSFSGRPVRKVMYTRWSGVDLSTMGFVQPNKHENDVLEYLKANCTLGQKRKQSLTMCSYYDKRFMAKLALGFNHVLFCNSNRNCSYINELRKALWYKEGDPLPTVYGRGTLDGNSDFLNKYSGVRNGSVVSILPNQENIVINLNIRQKLNWTIVCALQNDLNADQLESLKDGLCFVLYRPLSKVIRLSLPQLLAHNLGECLHTDIKDIEAKVGAHRNYFHNL